jgi:hypothetical protein
MKKIFLVSILSILAFSNGFGQSKKNDLKLTVSALPLFGSSDGFESGINGIVIKPSIGYFISDKTSIDLNFSYATLNDLTVGNIDSYYNSYAFIPTLRNNFVNKEKLKEIMKNSIKNTTYNKIGFKKQLSPKYRQ